jgi:nicotinamidase-related amidase
LRQGSRTADAELRARGIDTLIVGGLMTHLAVLITATDAAMLDYRVIVASDATATRALPGAGGEAGVDAQTAQRAALDIMADRVADVMRARAILALPVARGTERP